jgi:hypothetical protein
VNSETMTRSGDQSQDDALVDRLRAKYLGTAGEAPSLQSVPAVVRPSSELSAAIKLFASTTHHVCRRPTLCIGAGQQLRDSSRRLAC